VTTCYHDALASNDCWDKKLFIPETASTDESCQSNQQSGSTKIGNNRPRPRKLDMEAIPRPARMENPVGLPLFIWFGVRRFSPSASACVRCPPFLLAGMRSSPRHRALRVDARERHGLAYSPRVGVGFIFSAVLHLRIRLRPALLGGESRALGHAAVMLATIPVFMALPRFFSCEPRALRYGWACASIELAAFAFW